MASKAKIIVRQGNRVCFEGTIESVPKKYPTHDEEDRQFEEFFNIERYINEQGAYRCHIEILEEK